MAIGDALMAPLKRAGCSCSASTLPLPSTAVIARPCMQLDAFLEHVVQIFRHARHLARSCVSTVIIVTSSAPCRSASRAQSMAVLPPPMTATRGPSFTFDVPMPMSRRNGSP